MNDLRAENLLEQFESPEAIGNWLLTGFYNWPDYEKPWTQAFSPLPLYDDLYLERQLVKHFSLSSPASAENLLKALIWSLGQWIYSDHFTVHQHSSRVLKGLLNMVVEVKQTERFKSAFMQLLTETPKAVSFHIKIVNVLATLVPEEPDAIAVLNDFRNAKQWKPDFAPLTYIAYITLKPENWIKYLREFRNDFNKEGDNWHVIKTTLLPQIFFSYVVNTLGLIQLAKQLHQLEFKTICSYHPKEIIITPDQWFLVGIIGQSNSPLFALKDHNDNWYLTKYLDYPTGEKVIIESTNEDLEVYLKGYNNEKRCAFLTTRLVTSYAEEKITIEELDKAVDELCFSFSKSFCHHFISLAILESRQITSEKKQLIQEILNKISEFRRLQNPSELEQLVSMISHFVEAKGYPVTKKEVKTTIEKSGHQFSSKEINETIQTLKHNGLFLSPQFCDDHLKVQNYSQSDKIENIINIHIIPNRKQKEQDKNKARHDIDQAA